MPLTYPVGSKRRKVPLSPVLGPVGPTPIESGKLSKVDLRTYLVESDAAPITLDLGGALNVMGAFEAAARDGLFEAKVTACPNEGCSHKNPLELFVVELSEGTFGPVLCKRCISSYLHGRGLREVTFYRVARVPKAGKALLKALEGVASKTNLPTFDALFD